MKVIVDTSVLISTLLSPKDNAIRKIFDMARDKELNIVSCREIFVEITNTISTDRFKKYRTYNGAYISRFLNMYRHIVLKVKIDKNESHVLRDVNDAFLIDIYHIARADFLITHDKDLLEAQIPEVRIVTPAEFLKVLYCTHL